MLVIPAQAGIQHFALAVIPAKAGIQFFVLLLFKCKAFTRPSGERVTFS
jgi:hypothetical protein